MSFTLSGGLMVVQATYVKTGASKGFVARRFQNGPAVLWVSPTYCARSA